MLEYVRLQMKLTWGRNKNDSKKSAILTSILGLCVIAVMLALVYLLTSVLGNSLTIAPQHLATLFITIIEISITVMAVTMQLKRLYRPFDLTISARFALSTFKMYLANIILVYINLAIFAMLIFVPIMTVFTLSIGVFSIQMFIAIIIGGLLAPMLPFGLSSLIAIPVMYLMSLLENKHIIKIILFIAVCAGFFVLYNYILSMLAEYFIYSDVSTDTTGIWNSVILALNSAFNPCVYLGNMVFFNGAWLGLGVIIGLSVLFAAAGIAAAKPIYERVRKRMLEGGGSYFSQDTEVDNLKSGWAMLRHGFKEIIRTKTYAYFYLGIAIATPVMVFFCNRLVTDVGQAQLGATINFGASVLVITAFMAMISAFSAISISMEGKNFYLTKIIPVGYRKQLMIKGSLNMMVCFGALLISCIVLVALEFITPVQAVILGVLEILLSAGFVLNGINLNLANPNLKLKASGETDEINITVMMLLGLLIAGILGAVSIITPFFLEMTYMYLILAAPVIIYSLINILVFVFTAVKKYHKIEG